MHGVLFSAKACGEQPAPGVAHGGLTGCRNLGIKLQDHSNYHCRQARLERRRSTELDRPAPFEPSASTADDPTRHLAAGRFFALPAAIDETMWRKGLELINPAHSKLLAFEVQQIQSLTRLFRGFSCYLPRVCERYGRFGR